MDRLTALVALRWRLDMRAAMGARERLLALLLVVPGLMLLSAAGSFVVFIGTRHLERTEPQLTLPLLSALATAARPPRTRVVGMVLKRLRTGGFSPENACR